MSSISITQSRRSLALPIGILVAVAVAVVAAAAVFYLRPATTLSSIQAQVQIATDQNDRATLTLQATGLKPGDSYVVHLHAGAPDRPSASAGQLGTFTAASDGAGTLQTSTARMGGSGADVELTGALMRDAERFVDVHPADGSQAVAVAELSK
jgi:hypothetical protein